MVQVKKQLTRPCFRFGQQFKGMFSFRLFSGWILNHLGVLCKGCGAPVTGWFSHLRSQRDMESMSMFKRSAKLARPRCPETWLLLHTEQPSGMLSCRGHRKGKLIWIIHDLLISISSGANLNSFEGLRILMKLKCTKAHQHSRKRHLTRRHESGEPGFEPPTVELVDNYPTNRLPVDSLLNLLIRKW